MGSLMMQGAHIGSLGARVMAMIRGRAHAWICPRAKFVCLDHLLHFMVHFFLQVAKLCF